MPLYPGAEVGFYGGASCAPFTMLGLVISEHNDVGMTAVTRRGLSANESARVFCEWFNRQVRAARTRLSSFDNWEDFKKYFNGRERYAIYEHWVKLGRQVPKLTKDVQDGQVMRT